MGFSAVKTHVILTDCLPLYGRALHERAPITGTSLNFLTRKGIAHSFSFRLCINTVLKKNDVMINQYRNIQTAGLLNN